MFIMIGKVFLQLDCNNISIHKQSECVTIRLKANIQLNNSTPPLTQDILITNTGLLSNLQSRYSELFKQNVVYPQPKPIEPQPSSQNKQTVNIQQASKNSSQPYINKDSQSHNKSFPFGRKEEVPKDSNPSSSSSFRRSIFSTASQGNESGQRPIASVNPSFSNQNFNYNQQRNNMSSSSGQGNMFILPSSQQTPTIFDRGDRSSTSSDRDKGKNVRNSRTRIQ